MMTTITTTTTTTAAAAKLGVRIALAFCTLFFFVFL